MLKNFLLIITYNNRLAKQLSDRLLDLVVGPLGSSRVLVLSFQICPLSESKLRSFSESHLQSTIFQKKKSFATLSQHSTVSTQFMKLSNILYSINVRRTQACSKHIAREDVWGCSSPST